MPKASTSGAVLTKLASALDSMRSEFSTREFRRFDGKEYSTRFKISNIFSTVLRNLGAIQVNPNQRGEYCLTAKMVGLRPSTVLKHMNTYQNSCNANKKRKYRRKAKVPAQQYLEVIQPKLFSKEPTFDVIITALKEKMRKEIMTELMDSLTTA